MAMDWYHQCLECGDFYNPHDRIGVCETCNPELAKGLPSKNLSIAARSYGGAFTRQESIVRSDWWSVLSAHLSNKIPVRAVNLLSAGVLVVIALLVIFDDPPSGEIETPEVAASSEVRSPPVSSPSTQKTESVATPENKAHKLLVLRSTQEQIMFLALAVADSDYGDRCRNTSAKMPFFQGLDEDSTAFWNIMCGDERFTVAIKADAAGTSRVVPCSIWETMGQDDLCYKPLDDTR